MIARLIAAAAIAALAAPAAARPVGRDRPDADAAAEARSELWGELTRPGTAANRIRLEDALRTLRLRTGDLGQAADQLAEVTRAAPDQPEGWGYLAIAAERLRRWPQCAAAYEAVWRLDPAWRPIRLIERLPSRDGMLRALPLSIALCQSRAGDLDGAAATLSAAIARGESSPELWLRTGEVAMAQGRLDDAIAALERAGAEVGARWMLAVAADRARRDDKAQAAAELAQKDDAFGNRAGSTALPALAPGDNDYLLGFASERAGRPEYAITHFRRYLVVAPAAGPWRARAAEHLAALAPIDLAERATIDGGGASAVDRAAIVTAIRRTQPAFAACMKRIPTGLHEVLITVAPVIELKPMPWPTRRPAPRPRPAPAIKPGPTAPDVSAYPLIAPLRADDALDAAEEARACLERTAATVRLPPAGHGAWRVRVPVLAR